MEKDIKILKELLENANIENIDMNDCFGGEHLEAIENILNRLEQQNNNIEKTIKAIGILRQDFSEDLQVEFINLLNTLTGGEYLK